MPNTPQIDDPNMDDLTKALDTETQEVEEKETTEQELQKIKIGEDEYTQDQLNELVGLGKQAQEVGSHHGGFDKFVSEYGRRADEVGKLKRQIQQLETAKTSGAPVAEVEDQLQQARDAARRIGIVLQDDLENYYTNRRSGEKLLENCKELETAIDGNDGRPKFETESVLEFMQQNPGFSDPKRAYEAMHLDEISSWKAEQIHKKKGITTVTDTVGNKTPTDVKPNKDNLGDLIREALQ